MRVLHIIVLTTLALEASVVIAGDTPADFEIRMWEPRAKRDPEDGISSSNLGVAYLQKARESGDFSYYKKAETAFRNCLAVIPDHRAALVGLATTYNSEHRFKEAIPLARKVLDAVEEPAALGVFGDALLETGDLPGASKLYERLIELAPVPPGYARRASIQILKGDNDAAIESFKKAIELSSTGMPAESIAWFQVQVGFIYFSSGDLAHAQEYYEKALKTLPDYHQALDHLAELHGTRGEVDDAAAIYKQLIERTPRPDLLQALGDLYRFNGRNDEAAKYHAQALAAYKAAADAGNAHYYHHLAGFYCDVQDDPAEALKWAKKDIELRQSIYAYDTLAWAQYKNGAYAEAAENMKKALALGTKDAHLYFHAGLIYARAGDFEGGRTSTQKALKINPLFEKFHVHR